MIWIYDDLESLSHAASLFPGTAVLEERDRWVADCIGWWMRKPSGW